MSNEAEQREYDRILALADEDLNKTVPALLTDIKLAATRGIGPQGAPITMTLYRHAALLAVLSGQADVHSRRIVKLTKVLVGLTVALLLFTAYLSYDAYLKGEAIKEQQKDRTEKSESHVDAHAVKSPP